MKKPTRAVAIVIKENSVLLMKRRNKGKEYYVFPGGGVEDMETVEQAVLREVSEETTLQVRINKLLYHHHYINNSDQYFYLCTFISGEPKLGNANEKEEMEKNEDNFYQPLWIEVSKLNTLLVYPLEIRDWLIEDFSDKFQNPIREIEMKVEELHQSL